MGLKYEGFGVCGVGFRVSDSGSWGSGQIKRGRYSGGLHNLAGASGFGALHRP